MFPLKLQNLPASFVPPAKGFRQTNAILPLPACQIKENRIPSAQYPRRMPHSLACLLAHLRGSRPGLLQFTATWRHTLQVCFNLLQSVQLAVWSSGMILAQGARGPGPSSQNSPLQAWYPSWPGKRLSSHLDPGITRAPRHAHDHCVINMRLDKRSQGGSNSRP